MPPADRVGGSRVADLHPMRWHPGPAEAEVEGGTPVSDDRFCACASPRIELVEGVRVCSNCGGQVPDPRDRLLVLIAQQQRTLLSGNGSGAPAPTLAPIRIALTYEEAAQALGIGRALFIEEVLPLVRVLRIRGR